MEGVGLGAAGEGATAEFGVFLTENLREVGLLAYQMCGEREVAEEVAADAFAEACRCWDELANGEVPPLEAMHGIVERLAQGRVHGNGRTPTPQDGVEPDGERIRALFAERITLIPPQDAPTVMIPRIVEPAEPSEPEAAPTPRFRRPTVMSAAITAGSLAALGVIAMAVSSGNGTTNTNQSPLSLSATGSIGAGATGSQAAVISISGDPSRSASASPSHSPSASPTPSATTASASTSPTGGAGSTTASVGATGVATATKTTSSSALTASAAVRGNDGWTQLDVTTSVNRTLSALTITITVANCPGLYPADAWNSGAGGQFSETTTQNGDGSITYMFQLNPGNQVAPGQISFAAQFVHSRHGWSASSDTYSIAAQEAASGAGDSFGGAF